MYRESNEWYFGKTAEGCETYSVSQTGVLQQQNSFIEKCTRKIGCILIYGFKPVLPGLSGETDKPPAMRVRVEGYTKKFPKLREWGCSSFIAIRKENFYG